MPRRRHPIHYGNRFEVSAYVPTAELAAVATERTEGMVGYFLSCAHRDPLKWRDDLYALARSCYLQGAADVADAAATMQRKRATPCMEESVAEMAAQKKI
jgi:hypothetical protein